MAPTNPLIHVGHPKTASTWLHRNIFDCEVAGLCTPGPTAGRCSENNRRLSDLTGLDFGDLGYEVLGRRSVRPDDADPEGAVLGSGGTTRPVRGGVTSSAT